MRECARSAVFVGTMNAMPMAYALELRARGWNVTYLVDVPPEDTLSRPEYKFPQVTYPYPDWVIERRMRNQLIPALAPGLMLSDVIARIRRADAVFLSGLFLCLGRYARRDQLKVFLSYGSDLDLWCNRLKSRQLAELFAGRIGRIAARLTTAFVVKRMIANLRSMDVIATFPEGLSPPADQVLNRELPRSSAQRVTRYDISFEGLPPAHLIRRPPDVPELSIICGTRHTFRRHPGLADEENKGTDVIIRGLGLYRRTGGRPLRVHFFEKGLDLAEAKALCVAEGLDRCVVWHKQLGFQEFLQLHHESHIAFDQLGSHIVGGGMYAMYMGMPLIANGRPEVLQKAFGEVSPICQAKTPEEVAGWLRRLEDADLRKVIGTRSSDFARKYFNCARTVDAILDAVSGRMDCAVTTQRIA